MSRLALLSFVLLPQPKKEQDGRRRPASICPCCLYSVMEWFCRNDYG
jgi:hypothetical protein